MARLIDSSVFIELERRGKSLYALEPLISDASIALSSNTASTHNLRHFERVPGLIALRPEW